MKKSQIAEIINRLTDLEVEMARTTVSGLFSSVQRPFVMEWFQKINKITSDLDKICKGKDKITCNCGKEQLKDSKRYIGPRGNHTRVAGEICE